jgi:hypothetical protein
MGRPFESEQPLAPVFDLEDAVNRTKHGTPCRAANLRRSRNGGAAGCIFVSIRIDLNLQLSEKLT